MHKACFVAKSFHQQIGLDYRETFSPVFKQTTVCNVCSLAVFKGWPFRELDENNAFCHGFLNETIYTEQSSGFIAPLSLIMYASFIVVSMASIRLTGLVFSTE